MKVIEINGDKFKDMIRVATHRIKKNAAFVNSLNVFPVPDGDTGTNMTLTFASGAKAVNENPSDCVGELGKSLAKGLLMGARGNSGVITSQIFRGFTKKIENKQTLDARTLADAFMAGVESAYKAVMKPVEGTILTVAREGAKAGNRAANNTDDAVEVLKAVIGASKKALDNTPNLLPVLKEVGVVDSGGQGLVFIYEGFLEGLTGDLSDKDIYTPDEEEMDEMVNAVHHRALEGISTSTIKFGYCTEMMIDLTKKQPDQPKFDYEPFRQYLNNLGDSLLVVADDEVVKVHVHTEHPETVYAYGAQFGQLHKIKIDNMRIQNENVITNAREDEAQKPKKQIDYGIIAIGSGEGISQLFDSLGVTYVLNGGQTMNPSTQDILDAIEHVNAKRVILLPNNKNIFLSAKEAAKVAKVPVAVVQSQTISQGMTAMLSFDPSTDLGTNEKEMTDALSTVVSGQITTATRDTEINGLQIKKDEFLGLVDGDIKVANTDRKQAAIDTIKAMLNDESEIITIIYGLAGTKTEAQEIADVVVAGNSDLEAEIHEGDQPVYPYLISVE